MQYISAARQNQDRKTYARENKTGIGNKNRILKCATYNIV